MKNMRPCATTLVMFILLNAMLTNTLAQEEIKKNGNAIPVWASFEPISFGESPVEQCDMHEVLLKSSYPNEQSPTDFRDKTCINSEWLSRRESFCRAQETERSISCHRNFWRVLSAVERCEQWLGMNPFGEQKSCEKSLTHTITNTNTRFHCEHLH